VYNHGMGLKIFIGDTAFFPKKKFLEYLSLSDVRNVSDVIENGIMGVGAVAGTIYALTSDAVKSALTNISQNHFAAEVINFVNLSHQINTPDMSNLALGAAGATAGYIASAVPAHFIGAGIENGLTKIKELTRHKCSPLKISTNELPTKSQLVR
jgi:hypothetical protein